MVAAETDGDRERIELGRDDVDADLDVRRALTKVEVDEEDELFDAVDKFVIVDVVDIAQLVGFLALLF